MVTPRSARSNRSQRSTGGFYPLVHTDEESPICYHIQTRLPDGRQSIIIDPGSVGNLCGDQWAKQVATEAAKNGYRSSYVQRSKPLQVSGVGNGSQSCVYDCQLPLGLNQSGDNMRTDGKITIPSVQHSDLPGLLGLQALKQNRAVWDFVTNTLYFMGPGDYKLENALPTGTDSYQLVTAPSGHSVLPCCEYSSDSKTAEHTLTLMSRRGASSWTGPVRHGIPPAPSSPPVLPASSGRSDILHPPPAGVPRSSL